MAPLLDKKDPARASAPCRTAIQSSASRLDPIRSSEEAVARSRSLLSETEKLVRKAPDRQG